MQRVFSFEIRLEAVRLHEEEDLSPGAKGKNKGNKEKLKKTKELRK